MQTMFTPEKGNALQACASSILGLPLDLVPNFIEDPNGYWSSMTTHAASLALGLQKSLLGDGMLSSSENVVLPAEGCLCFVRGTSPRGAHGHVICGVLNVDRSVSLLHDPHPSAAFLDGEAIWVAVYTTMLTQGQDSGDAANALVPVSRPARFVAS